MHKGPRPQRQFNNRPKTNHNIRALEIKVIGADGEQLGVMKTSDAIKKALEDNLDLVEVSSTSNPPVARIMDFGKYMYQKEKQERSAKNSSAAQEIKTVRITFRAGDHDLVVRAGQADKFLEKKHRVKVELKLKGREKSPAMREMAKSKLNSFLKLLSSPYTVEGPAKTSPMGAMLLLIPSKTKKAE